ncbi:enterococcus pore-forming toxin Epx [Enterococcus hirae]|uniref:enterococcus pore-forming toxin Epx n=1 Tax=Enterococcus hirae TaxID=1354 RepID=UPI001A974921|nr:enterococcus pore-forming toxin Epx [Enterococcus hirae]MBO1088462.1 hypothetical protein [Enterococcus hirae]MEB7517923.1 enterococcus pore-forming toxin Epx [Enterococcus hirae]
MVKLKKKNHKIWLSITVLSAILTTAPVFADFSEDNILGTTTHEIDEHGNVKTIITVKNQQVENYTSTDSGTAKNHSTMTVNANFLNDKYSNELTTILSLNGFIPSGRKFMFPKNNTWKGEMMWPQRYSTAVYNESLDKPVKISDSTPNNTIRNKEVTNSITYGIGGGIKMEGKQPGANLDANAAITKTISYQQPDYETTKTTSTINGVNWNTDFTETRDGYTRNSWNPVYGNQLFMYGRYTYDVRNNFTPNYQLSSLITSGFSPSYGLVLRAPKDVKKSRIKVVFARRSEIYQQNWDGANWWGNNFYDNKRPNSLTRVTLTFDLDWQNHRVTFIQ